MATPVYPFNLHPVPHRDAVAIVIIQAHVEQIEYALRYPVNLQVADHVNLFRQLQEIFPVIVRLEKLACGIALGQETVAVASHMTLLAVPLAQLAQIHVA